MRLSPVLFSAYSRFGSTSASDEVSAKEKDGKEVSTDTTDVPRNDEWFDGTDWADLSRSVIGGARP